LVFFLFAYLVVYLLADNNFLYIFSETFDVARSWLPWAEGHSDFSESDRGRMRNRTPAQNKPSSDSEEDAAQPTKGKKKHNSKKATNSFKAVRVSAPPQPLLPTRPPQELYSTSEIQSAHPETNVELSSPPANSYSGYLPQVFNIYESLLTRIK
jgi:hypothetical protein